MDTSETYIKMCEKAEEIQFNWTPDTGDIFAPLPLDSQLVLLTEHLNFRRDATTDRLVQIAFPKATHLNLDYKKLTAKCVWLPRQDQLQEMVLPDPSAKGAWGEPIEKDGKADSVFWMFHDFNKTLQERKWSLQTGEQLWLRYVMSKKYNKIWDGKSWMSDGTTRSCC